MPFPKLKLSLYACNLDIDITFGYIIYLHVHIHNTFTVRILSKIQKKQTCSVSNCQDHTLFDWTLGPWFFYWIICYTVLIMGLKVTFLKMTQNVACFIKMLAWHDGWLIKENVILPLEYCSLNQPAWLATANMPPFNLTTSVNCPRTLSWQVTIGRKIFLLVLT